VICLRINESIAPAFFTGATTRRLRREYGVEPIRAAKSEDLPAIQAVARRTIDACYRPFLGNEGVETYLNSGACDAYLAENLEDCRVLVDKQHILGFSVCKADLIDLMMVDVNAHRRGYGSVLLSDCEDRLFERYSEIRLESFEGNESANAFYVEHEWRNTGRDWDEASGTFKLHFRKRSP
jgi:ribosomal protein S18 acetylase RimI-like enzyme